MKPNVKSSSRLSQATGVLLGVTVVVLAFAPFMVDSGVLRTLVEVCVYVTLALMWNLLCGYGGMPSIGQHAFIGLSAYMMFALGNKFGVQPFLAWFVSIALCGVLAWPLTHLLFRLRDGYFAIGTWVVAETLRLVVANSTWLGGGSGMTLTAFRGMDSELRTRVIYWLALAVAFGAIAMIYLLLRSRFGLALTAIRDNERSAAAIGIDVKRIKTIVFVLSSVGFAAAGGIYFMSSLRVSPDSAFNIQWSAILIFIVVIGGIGSIEGPLLGALLYLLMLNYFSDSGTWYLIGLGSMAIFATLILKSGLWGFISDRLKLNLFPVTRYVNHARKP